ncbi:MAG TPA: hypothetical protein VGX70_20535, partial [Gemmataceae bacterium]|nr:hypothetical protein [Gemmataceae bacterium]
MASASVGNMRLWWTGAVALGLVTIGGWHANRQNAAFAQNAPKSQSKEEKKTEEKKTDEQKIASPTLSTFVTYPQVKVINDQIG